MPVDWMKEFISDVDADKQRKQDFSDANRKTKIEQYRVVNDNIQKQLALMLNPDTMEPLPGKEQHAAQLRQIMTQVDSYLQNLYNPNFNPATGMVPEDALHKFTDKLHLTKPPQQPMAKDGKTPAQQLDDLHAIQQKYGDSTAIDTRTKQRTQEMNIDNTRALAKKYNLTEEAIAEITEHALGHTPKPQKGQWELMSGTVSGQPVTWQRNKADGTVTDLAGNEVAEGLLKLFVPTPKQSNMPKVGSFGEFLTAAYGANPTPQQILQGRKLWAESAAAQTSGTHVIQVPQPDGTIKAFEVTTTNKKTFPGATAPTPQAPPTTGATQQYETKLTPEEEQKFQAWKAKYAPNDSGADYDLRGAFKAGLTPDAKTGHWPDTYKKPNHPTFSNESVYAKGNPNAPHWENGKLVSRKAPGQQKRDLQNISNKRRAGDKAEAAKQVSQMWATAHGIGVKEGPVIGGKLDTDFRDTKIAYQASIDRAKIMDMNLSDARKSGSQQAMLSLVANHIGMTLGAQKGARINQAVWIEAVKSAPWTEAFYAKMFHQDESGDYVFDGWKSGVTLTDDQMQQMVDLAHEKVEILREHLGRVQPGKGGAAQGGNGPKKKVSLSKAMKLAVNTGKTEAEVRKDIEAHGHEVIP